MLEHWSKDRINIKVFQHEVLISNEMFEIAYNWIWQIKCCVYQMNNQHLDLVAKEKDREQLVFFEKLINNSCELDFDGLGDLIKKISLVVIRA